MFKTLRTKLKKAGGMDNVKNSSNPAVISEATKLSSNGQEEQDQMEVVKVFSNQLSLIVRHEGKLKEATQDCTSISVMGPVIVGDIVKKVNGSWNLPIVAKVSSPVPQANDHKIVRFSERAEAIQKRMQKSGTY